MYLFFLLANKIGTKYLHTYVNKAEKAQNCLRHNNSLVNAILFYANFTNAQIEKVPIPHLPRAVKLVLSENMRSGQS